MTDYTQPLTTAFELQRKTLKQNQKAAEQLLTLNQNIADPTQNAFKTQESLQRTPIEFHQQFTNAALNTIEENVPETDDTLTEFRTAVNDQYETLLENHKDAFETITDELENTLDDATGVTDDYLEIIDEQLELLFEVHEELENQSVETITELQTQFEDIQSEFDTIETTPLDAIKN